MQSDVEARLADLEARVAALEGTAGVDAFSPTSDADGTVTFAGDVQLPIGVYKYQWIRPAAWVTDQPWDEAMERIAALAHPVRGAILRHLLDTPATAAELVEAGHVSSLGTAYHHLKELQAAGWVTKRDGVFAIPPARVVPLMAIVIAGEAH